MGAECSRINNNILWDSTGCVEFTIESIVHFICKIMCKLGVHFGEVPGRTGCELEQIASEDCIIFITEGTHAYRKVTCSEYTAHWIFTN